MDFQRAIPHPELTADADRVRHKKLVQIRDVVLIQRKKVFKDLRRFHSMQVLKDEK